MHKILVADDDATLRQLVTTTLVEHGYQVDEAADGEAAVTKVQAGKYDLVLLDVNMPKMSGLQALKEIKSYDPSILAIILTAFSNVRDAVEATKEGAYNYLEKPVKAINLVYMIDRALKAKSMVKNMTYSAPVIRLPNGSDFVGQSNEMKRIFEIIDRLARVDTAVLIRGESGTGKELVAKALHFNGPRKDNRFVTVNCSAIPETLIESEFFGHEKGSFTGADARKIGKFQYADGGTLFLDEIGDISPAMQVKLLRVLQEKRFTPVGSNREIEVNVRIVAATNRNLEDMIRAGQFREDLFYRLNVLPIQLPPLRERKNDIEVLARHFVEKFNADYGKSVRGLSEEAMDAMRAHSWPGNIRELENVIEHAFVLESTDQLQMASLPKTVVAVPGVKSGERTGELIKVAVRNVTADDLDSDHDDATDDSADEAELNVPTAGSFQFDFSKLDFQHNKEEFEKQFLIMALRAFNGRINQTAIHANIPKKTLLRKLEKYGINAREYSIKA